MSMSRVWDGDAEEPQESGLVVLGRSGALYRHRLDSMWEMMGQIYVWDWEMLIRVDSPLQEVVLPGALVKEWPNPAGRFGF